MEKLLLRLVTTRLQTSKHYFVFRLEKYDSYFFINEKSTDEHLHYVDLTQTFAEAEIDLINSLLNWYDKQD